MLVLLKHYSCFTFYSILVLAMQHDFTCREVLFIIWRHILPSIHAICSKNNNKEAAPFVDSFKKLDGMMTCSVLKHKSIPTFWKIGLLIKLCIVSSMASGCSSKILFTKGAAPFVYSFKKLGVIMIFPVLNAKVYDLLGKSVHL